MEGWKIGYYGKLPLSREFIRHNASGPEVLDIDQWFQEGVHYAKSELGAGWSVDFAQADAWNFLFFPEGRSRFLIGSCIPSQDQAGREFAFFLFLRAEVAAFRGATSLAPLAVASFLEESAVLVRSGWLGLDLQGFRSRLESLSPPAVQTSHSVKDKYHQFLRTQTVRGFWAELLGDFNHPNKYRLDHALMNCLEPLRSSTSKHLAYGLKFPLMPGRQREAYDIAFWLELCSRWLAHKTDATLLLWSRNPSKVKPCLMASFGPPSSNLVLFVLRPDLQNDAWYELAPETPDDPGGMSSGLPADRRALLENGDMCLEEFLAETGERKA